MEDSGRFVAGGRERWGLQDESNVYMSGRPRRGEIDNAQYGLICWSLIKEAETFQEETIIITLDNRREETEQDRDQVTSCRAANTSRVRRRMDHDSYSDNNNAHGFQPKRRLLLSPYSAKFQDSNSTMEHCIVNICLDIARSSSCCFQQQRGLIRPEIEGSGLMG